MIVLVSSISFVIGIQVVSSVYETTEQQVSVSGLLTHAGQVFSQGIGAVFSGIPYHSFFSPLSPEILQALYWLSLIGGGMLGVLLIASGGYLYHGRWARNSAPVPVAQAHQLIFTRAGEGIVVTNAQRQILQVNPAFIQVTGYSAAECLGQHPRMLQSGEHDRAFYQAMWQSLQQTGAWEGEIWNRRKNGEIYSQWLSINAIRNKHGEITHYVGIFRDLTDLKQREEQLIYQEHYDALTGLPNRHLFHQQLLLVLAHARQCQHEVGIISIDLDGFKNINDSFGHQMGDLLLREAAQRLQSCCQEGATLARWSGGQFMLLLPKLERDGEDAIAVANAILQAFARPFFIESHELFCPLSIGISISPNDGEDAAVLEQNADTALYRAKEQGHNRYMFYAKRMHEELIARLELEKDLHKALKSGEFRLYYQPKVDVKSGKITGTEALLRWQRSASEVVPPDRFIPTAEETGLILPLGAWVLRSACQQTKVWQENGFPNLSISVNLSAKQFQDDHLIDVVQNVLKETGLAAHDLCLEITEHTLIGNMEAAIDVMAALQALGVQFSIDDFGTGYSSLNYLRRLPLHQLKIDRSFVREIPHQSGDMAIAKAILSLSHTLNLTVLAEGVETTEQLNFLQEHDCDEMQGFLFSQPVPVDEVTTLLQTGKQLGA